MNVLIKFTKTNNANIADYKSNILTNFLIFSYNILTYPRSLLLCVFLNNN